MHNLLLDILCRLLIFLLKHLLKHLCISYLLKNYEIYVIILYKAVFLCQY